MRLIDADALMEMVNNTVDMIGNTCVLMNAKDFVRNFINNQPTIDAVPVVRCKDCRWKEHEQPGMVYCPATVGGWVDEDWFCKGGETDD